MQRDGTDLREGRGAGGGGGAGEDRTDLVATFCGCSRLANEFFCTAQSTVSAATCRA